MKTENFTRCTCDCCGKTDYASQSKPSLMQQFQLPMKCYSGKGEYIGDTSQEVDLCANCLRELELNLTKHYTLYCTDYGGVTMERRVDDGKGTDN